MSVTDDKYGQIMFFKKNKIDLENPNAQFTITDTLATNDGTSYINLVRNRNNFTGWATTGSCDISNTEICVELGETRYVNDIALVVHNFAAFQIQWWTGLTWQDFPTPINVTGNTEEVSFFTDLDTQTNQLRIVITGTMVPDTDKFLAQWIVTERLGVGQLEAWPEIKSPTHNTNKKISRMLSGKIHMTESLGSFKCNLSVKFWKNLKDLELVEKMYFGREGFLMWLAGNDEAQFHFAAQGYRARDFYMVRPTDSYKPEYYKSWYRGGLKMSIKLEESIT